MSGRPPDLPVLVVDDEPVDRMFATMALQLAGFATVEATTVAEAEAVLASRPVVAVVLDDQMPGGRGIDLISSLRSDERTATLPVILVTGSDRIDLRTGLSAGATDYLVKPVDADELVSRVFAHLESQSRWFDAIGAELRRRAHVMALLAAVDQGPTTDAVAERLCRVLHAELGLDGAAIVRGDAGGLSVLAACGQPRWTAAIERMVAVPGAAFAGRLDHPWVEHAGRGLVAPPVVTALSPLRVKDSVFGLLVLGGGQHTTTLGAAATADGLLAQTVDFGLVVARVLGGALERDASRRAGQRELLATIRERRFFPVFQPIIDLRTRAVAGYEALTRFDDETPPNERFADAARCGLGPQLELATMAAAVDAARGLRGDAFISLNVSPDLVLTHADEIREILDDEGERPVVLELTEHEEVPDYDAFRVAIDGLRPRVRLSVDDAGAGFASLRHIVQLGPDYVKLDRSWVSGIDQDPTRQALVAGLAHFTRQTAATLIAEGIETEAERDKIEELDVAFGQGYLLGRPEAV